MISRAVAALADSALLLPASLAVAAYLAWLREVRLAAAWLGALALSAAATIAAKLLFHACGHAIGDVVSPSGHASFGLVFYGALAILLGSGRSTAVKAALGLGAGLLVVAVAISRVRTGAHSGAEVAIGLAVGGAALAVFAALHARSRPPALPWLPIAVGFGVAVLLLGGLHFSLEHRIARLARQLSAALDVCGPPERGMGFRRLLGY